MRAIKILSEWITAGPGRQWSRSIRSAGVNDGEEKVRPLPYRHGRARTYNVAGQELEAMR
jgi:hypothetical protein